jgi:hypothetical protein
MRGLPVITLGSQSFAGPFMLPLWSPVKACGLYAVLVPGWRPLTFRAVHFGQTEDFTRRDLVRHSRYAEWLGIAGTEWNLYVAVHDMSFSTEAQRLSAERALTREYKPGFTAAAGAFPSEGADAPSLKALLLARALRAQEQ